MKIKILIGSIQQAPYPSVYKEQVVDEKEGGIPTNVMKSWVDNGWAEEVGVEAEVEAKPEVKEEVKSAGKGKTSKHKGKE